MYYQVGDRVTVSRHVSSSGRNEIGTVVAIKASGTIIIKYDDTRYGWNGDGNGYPHLGNNLWNVAPGDLTLLERDSYNMD